MTPKDQLVAWLNDAYAMEKGVAEILRHHFRDAKDTPEVKTFIEDHLATTETHAEQVSQCLLGLKTIPVTAGCARFSGLFDNFPTSFPSDILLQNTLTECAIEHFEIARYASLVTAASTVGEEEIAITCEHILEEEKTMVEFLEGRIEEMTAVYFEKLAAA